MSSDTNTDWCEGCGLCCMHMGEPPHCTPIIDGQFVHADDVFGDTPYDDSDINYALLMAAPMEARQVILNRREDETADDNVPCVWLDLETTRCKYHRFRPLICRDYPVGGIDCRANRVEAQLTIEGMPVVEEAA